MRIIRTVLIVFSIAAAGLFAISELIIFAGRDTTLPQITAETDTIEVTSEYTRDDLMQGIYAWDDEEGDLTSKVVLSSLSRFVDKGVCSLTYVVFDSSDQSASLTRKVKFTDYHSPRFTLKEPMVFRAGEGTYDDITERLGAQDVLDGNRKDWIIRTDSNLNFQSPGDYSISVQVSNSYGDTASETLPVHVVEAEDQRVQISLGTGIVYIEVGEKLDAADYITGVESSDGGKMSASDVKVSSDVETKTPGCYEVHYQAEDSSGQSGETWLTVIVEDGGDV